MVPDGWTSTRLGNAFINRRQKGKAGLPTLSVTLNDGLVDRSSLDRKTDTNLVAEEHLYVMPGDIAYNMMRMWQGASGLCNKEGLVSPAYVVLGPNKAVHPDFMAYLLKSPRMIHSFWAYSYGLTDDRLRLYFKDFSVIPVLLPPLDEQRRIADILRTWDCAVATADKLVLSCRSQKMALMHKLFVKKERLPGFTGKWKQRAFSDLFVRVKSKNSVLNTNVLTISAQHGLVSQTDYFTKSVAGKDLSNYILLKKGDFAYNKSYSAGFPIGAIKPLELYDDGVVSSLYICFRIASDAAHQRFFRHYFDAGIFNREIYDIAQEGARNHGLLNVSVTDFFQARVFVPSPEEQSAIAAVIDAAEQELQTTQQYAKRLRLEKRALMQDLFTGRRRVRLRGDKAA
jgi:type I restriction enzyme, S subunit